MFKIHKLSFSVVVFLGAYNKNIFCQTEFSTSASSEQFNPCPSPSELSPYCVCTPSSDVSNLLDCSQVQNENQLELVFTKDIFSSDFEYELLIKDNVELKYLSRNVFGNLSFVAVTFDHVNELEYIDESTFSNSYSTINVWEMIYCNLLPQGFPFYSLRLYTSLDTLILNSVGKVDVLPKIYSSSIRTLKVINCEINYLHFQAFSELPNLTYLYVIYNTISTLPKGLFDQNTKLKILHLYYNNIQQLLDGTFKDLINLQEVDVSFNKITHVEPGAFYNLPSLQTLDLRVNYLPYFLFEHLGFLPTLNQIYISNNDIIYIDRDLFHGCPKIKYVNANNMKLSSIEGETFSGLKNGTLMMSNNLLTTLDENWLRTLLVNKNVVYLSSNPLECGCDLAWLFEDPTLMDGFLYAQCPNGTLIQDLDHSYFIDSC